MKLIINLRKARQGLVLKKVAIRGKDGKIHYGNRWVRPGEEGTPVKASGQEEQTGQKPLGSIPDVGSVKEQAEPVSTPRTEESVEPVEESKPGVEVTNESEIIPKARTVYDEPLDEYDEEDLIGEFKVLSEWSASLSECMEEAGKYLSEEMRDVIIESVTDMIDGDDRTNSYQKDVQKRTLRIAMDARDGFSRIGSEPRILRLFLKTVLGEETYTEANRRLSTSNLTINGDEPILKSIRDQGVYRASTPHSFARAEGLNPDLAESNVDILMKLSREHKDMDLLETQMNAIVKEELTKPSTWDRGLLKSMDSLTDRLAAEHKTSGLLFHEPKPTYVAYNPFSNPGGGSDYYGDSSIVISEEILPECTLNIGDSFDEVEPIAKISGMEHMHDLALLKSLSTWYSAREGAQQMKDEPLYYSDDKGHFPRWAQELTMAYSIPLELQYHRGQIDKEHMLGFNLYPVF